MGALMRGRLLVGAVAVIALLAAVAVACGGGGDGEEAIQSTLVPEPRSRGTPAGTPADAATPPLSRGPGGAAQGHGPPSQRRARWFQPGRRSPSAPTRRSPARATTPTRSWPRLTEWGRVLGHGVVFSSDDPEMTGVLLVDSYRQPL